MQTNLSVQDTASWTFNKLIFSWLAALFHSIGANVVGLGWGHFHHPSAAPEMREDVADGGGGGCGGGGGGRGRDD